MYSFNSKKFHILIQHHNICNKYNLINIFNTPIYVYKYNKYEILIYSIIDNRTFIAKYINNREYVSVIKAPFNVSYRNKKKVIEQLKVNKRFYR